MYSMSTAVAASKAAKTPTYPPLTAADRCDGTRTAQALVRLVRGKQDMLLSAHYFNKAEATLIGAGWVVYEDIREAVLNPPKTTYDTSEH
jgi:hypothetical protein